MAIWVQALLTLASLSSCKHKPSLATVPDTQFPPQIEAILLSRCATAGCHNDKSKEGAGGLSLETWDKMFEGSRGGSVVIPYRPDYSTLAYYLNTDSTRGLALKPTMPFNGPYLSDIDYQTVVDWIKEGAPDKYGNVKFADDSSRSMFFTANQGCDVVTVFDTKTMLAMRCVDIGADPTRPEAAHQVKAAPNNKFFCVCFIGGSTFQKFSLKTFQKTGEVELGAGSWNTFSISSDSKRAYTFELNTGKMAIIDLEAMTARIITGGAFIQPHGTALNKTDDTVYVTGQTGNFLYKINTTNLARRTVTINGRAQSTLKSLDPHEIHFSPDFSKYFLTCQESNEVRVMARLGDSLLRVIPVGGFPQEMGVSEKYPYLFVSCMEDASTFPGKRGSIYVINYNDYSIVAKIYAGHQSHGIAVDDVNSRVYISNRNVSPGGPAPHHSSLCGGVNGYITAIDMKTLQLVPGYKAEVSVDPYGIGITH